MAGASQPRVPVRTVDLIGLLLLAMSWLLTAALFAGRWLFGPGWFGPHREWAALGVSVVLSAYYAIWGRRQVRRYYLTAQTRGQLSRWQALAVVALVMMAAAFGTWLFVRGRP
jgi:hypothetical protein